MVLLPANMTSRQAYLDSHPSINASMQDFEAREFSPTMPDLPSQHSGFRSPDASEYSESSRRSFSPPPWRKAGSGWFKHHSLSPHKVGYASKEPSPQYHSAEEEGDGDFTTFRSAMRIPLPASPTKGRSPSNSPEPMNGAGANEGDRGGGDTTLMGNRRRFEADLPSAQTKTESNYIRFTSSIAVQQRTDGIEQAVLYIRKAMHHVSKSRYNALMYGISTLFLYWLCANLLSTPSNGPVPDLIKVAGLAKSFEPVIYYSEAGHQQIGELQDTGVAVWDLGESVRNTNMTSAPMIVSQLEGLSDSFKDLSIEMTSFFAGLDADVDAILLVMEWAQRELTKLSQAPQSTIGSVWSNAHGFLSSVGVLSKDSAIMKDLMGQTIQQQTRSTLERLFSEFLNVLEESINNELQYSLRLFSLFEAVDKQFLNLHRTVIREQDQQERTENDFLSSMWTRVVGVNASRLRKFEKNKGLLQSVRDRTVRNKHVLLDHNQRLRQMKSALEMLRQRLVSPLVRNTNSSTLSVEEQILGLEGTYHQLKATRDEQKTKKMALIYGARSRRDELQADNGLRSGSREIEGRVQ
ncbi:hypothetical protein LTR37_010757 [Vermiconidia calcicola]|uniref:Uncharacterized protein n=1 Tax=Vermiconidia calcicola TaxID=1690605 RepID=A0ACC3N5E7_9PEZI|nr:hypothetical protein LTR37_010757 [Vermiconidia calcicola]